MLAWPYDTNNVSVRDFFGCRGVDHFNLMRHAENKKGVLAILCAQQEREMYAVRPSQCWRLLMMCLV